MLYCEHCMAQKNVLLLHDRACLHYSAAINEAIRQLTFKLLPHPPYSPDLAPVDYHMFGPLKEALHGRSASDDEEHSADVALITTKKFLDRCGQKACETSNNTH